MSKRTEGALPTCDACNITFNTPRCPRCDWAPDVVPDGGDHHEHQAAKQIDLGVNEDGYATSQTND